MKACGKNMEDRGKLVGDWEKGEKSIVSLKKKRHMTQAFFLIENLISFFESNNPVWEHIHNEDFEPLNNKVPCPS